MQTWDTAEQIPSDQPDTGGLSLKQFEAFQDECKNQPQWRSKADREADYFDGNQLDSDILRKQQAIGMPAAIEPLMGPALSYIAGMEAKTRRDWRVIPNGVDVDDDIADAMNAKLNEAERYAKADKACSNAFLKQAGLGIGWVEVSRNSDPFKFPYRCAAVHRNEIWYDWKGTQDPDMHDHRFLRRRRWTDKEQAKLLFPDQAELIENAACGWRSYEQFPRDGGHSTGLQMSGEAPTSASGYGSGTSTPNGLLSTAYQAERGSSIEEQEWRDTTNKRVALEECWYRVWARMLVLRSPDGRVVEYDAGNEMHALALSQGLVTAEYAVVSKVRLSWWLGPHKLVDTESPYKHNRFPYVPFWHNREDRTGVPYGLGRAWMYLQDTVNATLSKLRWGLSAVRVERTKGAVMSTDAQFRAEIARSDADIILDPKAMAVAGASFKVERDFQLTDQQRNMLEDSREGIKRTGSINSAYMGEGGQARSGVANQSLVEQASLGQGGLFDNFQESRTEVGELLMSLVIEDLVGVETRVNIKGDVVKPKRTVTLNQKGEDGTLTNDISRTRLKVALEDVPSTPSYRSQQLQSFSEAFKSTPTEFQRALFPHMLSLMDVPKRDEAINAVRDASQQPSQEDIQKQIEDAVHTALMESDAEYRMAQLELARALNAAKIKKLTAETVATGTTAAYEAMQAAGVVIAAPQAAPVADEILKGAGYTVPTPGGVDPGISEIAAGVPLGAGGVNPVPPSTNTSPGFPPQAESASTGIETPQLR